MLDALNFVKGAVSRKDFVPELTHFLIRDGRIVGYNGKLSLSAPIALNIDCCPKAVQMVKAIEACTDTVGISMTPSRKLAIKSGAFRAHVETLDSVAYPEVSPQGEHVAVDGHMLPALAALYELIAEDASRPWAAGLLLDGQSAYATNNVILAECWLGYHFPYRITIPRYAVKEVLRIGEEPVGLQMNARSITFHYEGGRWLRTQLTDEPWPDAAGMLLARMPPYSEVPSVPEGLFDALDTLAPFVDDVNHVYMMGTSVGTALTEGMTVDVAGVPREGMFNLKMLLKLRGIATHIDLAYYPRPVPFYGSRLRGVVMGMRA